MIDNETYAMLRAEEARLEGEMERDLADLARLDRLRKHAFLDEVLQVARSQQSWWQEAAELLEARS